jgi:hypothetical protein
MVCKGGVKFTYIEVEGLGFGHYNIHVTFKLTPCLY